MSNGGSDESGPCIGILDNDRCALSYLQLLVRHVLSTYGEHLRIWSSSNPATVLQRCRTDTPNTDVMLIDMALDNISGVQVAAEIRSSGYDIGIIGITAYQSDLYRAALQAAGAQALLNKDDLPTTLRPALTTVLQGQCYPAGSGFLDVRQARQVCHTNGETQPSAIPSLTTTERAIIDLGLRGYTAKQIAVALGSRTATVYSHQRNIRGKFHINEWYKVLERCKALHFHG
ncbi:response regulator [Bifidobacterium simiarum]|uniref:response regulator n=1 Tax=Bifidobacterium simiarum TaxID=2045441 RepID=UPI001BDC9180|nr:response regulator [Bifidobacterium simiarum]MBT1166972.1 response regulator transcription factor [Bifidobacterium simiarum]